MIFKRKIFPRNIYSAKLLKWRTNNLAVFRPCRQRILICKRQWPEYNRSLSFSVSLPPPQKTHHNKVPFHITTIPITSDWKYFYNLPHKSPWHWWWSWKPSDLPDGQFLRPCGRAAFLWHIKLLFSLCRCKRRHRQYEWLPHPILSGYVP